MRKQQETSNQGWSVAGFSLLEMMLAMVIFLVVSGSAFGLLVQHQPVFTDQQNIAGLNIGLRNAISELQIDLANAGTGYYPGSNIPDWPVGVTVTNNPASSSCYNSTTNTYGSTCFDSMSVIAVDDNTQALLHPQNSAGGCADTGTTSIYAPATAGLTAPQTAALFKSGDEVLLVKNDGSQYTAVVLTSNASVSSGLVLLSHAATTTSGGVSGINASDPLVIAKYSNSKLGSNFCPADWVMRIKPITYQVDATDSTNPKLTRTQNGVTDTLAEQVIGFKVGATIWNAAAGTSSDAYNFDASTYGPNSDGTLAYQYTYIRSVRISLIGRTKPILTKDYRFRNSFDGGPYQVQSIAVSVDPRNLSMR